MDDILKSIKAQLYERAISPVTGSFVIAWCLWNYRFFLVLFSELTLAEKLEWIDCELFDTWSEILIWGFFGPVFSTVIYLFAYPFLARKVFRFVRKKQVEMLNDKKEIDGGALLTEKQARALYSQIDQLEEEQQRVIERKDREIERRDEQIEQQNVRVLKIEEERKALDDELMKLKQVNLTKKNRNALHALVEEDAENKKEKLSEKEIKILRVVADYDGDSISAGSIVDITGLHRVRFDQLIESLLVGGYIDINPFSKGGLDDYYSLADKGRQYLLDNDLI